MTPEQENEAIEKLERAAHEHANFLAHLLNKQRIRPSAEHSLGLLMLAARVYAVSSTPDGEPMPPQMFASLCESVYRFVVQDIDRLREAAKTGVER